MAKNNFRDNWDVDDPIDIDDNQEIDLSMYIDMDEIAQNASNESKFMLKDLEKVYSNEKFMKEHPDYKKRIDIELESLRILLTMRKSDEVTHNLLVKQIGMTPNNASLYSALNRMQTSLLNIQTKLESTIKNINNLLKNYQLELPFEGEETVNFESLNSSTGEDQKDVKQVYRGTKSFIEDMNAKIIDDNLPNQLELFEENNESI